MTTADPVLDPYETLPLGDALAAWRELVQDPRFPTVQRWREAGRKVVGHYQVYFPEEIVHAAGMLPFKVRGAPVEARQGESRFGSYLCSILKTSLEVALSDHLDLDMFVSHPICDAARNLGAVWERNFAFPCEVLSLPHNASSAYASPYLREEYARIARLVGEVAGREVTDDDLAASIVLFNENRRLLRELYAVKRDAPWLIAADEAYTLVALGGMVPREEHNAVLAWVLSRLPQRPATPQDRMRLVFEGGFCEQPPMDLLHTIGKFAYIVDDDLLIGLRWITGDVPAGADPLGALAECYLTCSSYSPVQHDERKPKEQMLIKRIHDASAGAAVIAAAKMCEPGLDEIVAYTKALDEAGIPYFVTEFEETMSDFDTLQLQLETFIENLLFALE